MHRENIKNISPKSLEEHCTWCNIQMNATLPFPENTGEKVRTVPLPPPQQKHEFTAAASHLSQSGSILKKRPYPLFFAELRNWSCNTNAVATHENLSGFPDCASDAATTLDICFTR